MLTIEQIRAVLAAHLPADMVSQIADSIVAIRTAAYNEGWDDRDSGVGPDDRKSWEEAPAKEWYDAPTVEEAMKNLDAITEIEFGKPRTDTNAIDELVNFVRTPEWSVSMLEDIAEIVREARPAIGEEFDADDDRAWRPH